MSRDITFRPAVLAHPGLRIALASRAWWGLLPSMAFDLLRAVVVLGLVLPRLSDAATLRTQLVNIPHDLPHAYRQSAS